MSTKLGGVSKMWLLPSLNRPQRLVRLFKLFEETFVSTPGVVILHLDDVSDYSKVVLPTGWEFYRTPEITDSPGENIRRWMALNFTDQKWLGLLTDDPIPVTPHWDTKLIGDVTGKNIISCNDRWCAPGRFAGVGVFSGDWLRAVGYMFPPGFNWMYADDVWELLGRKTGSWLIRMDVVVEHQSPLKREHVSEQDDTFHKVMGFLGPDQIAFEKWKQGSAYPNAVTAIKNLQKSGR